MNIASSGQITVKPLGGDVNAPPIEVAIIGTSIVDPEQKLKKSLDGNIRFTDENIAIESNQQAKLLTGFLEKSNVNAIDEMVNSLDQQRKFEMHVKFIQMAEELDSAGASLIRLPGM